MRNKILIVGGVAGGASTAARLRRLDENAEIIIFEKGEYISYANCGLPYYIGDTIKDRDALLVQKPEVMQSRFNVDIRLTNEVISINKEKKQVEVHDLNSNTTYTESYDTLVLSTGSTPIKPPIEGIDAPNIFTLWTIPDTDAIKNYINEHQPKTAAVIGGGFIGLEMAENLHALGIKVSLIEMLDQVMTPLDYGMAQILHENIRANHVDLILKDGVKRFSQNQDLTTITLQSGKTVDADMVILSIGVRPNSTLAKNSGLEINERGGIVVDDYLKTSDENIYAIGDVIEVTDFVNKDKTMIPLAGPANKQGRICANNIYGRNEPYKGTQGTAIAKVFDMTAASTGVNEKTLSKMGLKDKEDYFTAIIYQKSHAGYYPGASPLALKMIFDKTGKIYGAQIVGQEGVDKRIDTIATAMRLGGKASDLKELELAYAPPYSSAKDPVNMLGFVAENILNGLVDFINWDEYDSIKGSDQYQFLDVSEDVERMVGYIEDSIHIPLGSVRNRINELDKNKTIVVYCAIGVRSYVAARILDQNGFNTKVFAGGFNLYKSMFHKTSVDTDIPKPSDKDIKNQGVNSDMDIKETIKVDCSGLQCPGPIMKVFKTMNELDKGDIIEVSATDVGFGRDVESWCKRTDNTMLKAEKRGKEQVVWIQKGLNNPTPACDASTNKGISDCDGKSMIVFSGDLDKVLASFIIANGAASMGRKVTMFFTFWGLNALRKTEKVRIKKSFLDSMFGAMMPRGTGKLKLSKMHMGGMGTAMMKKVMKDKNVDSLEDLIKQAMENGVNIVACTMSMDVMGLTKDELIDGIDYAGVASYLSHAEESNVNLFI